MWAGSVLKYLSSFNAQLPMDMHVDDYTLENYTPATPDWAAITT